MKKIISVIASLMLAIFVVVPIGGEAIEVPNNSAAARVSFSTLLTSRINDSSEVLNDGEEETSFEQETTEGETQFTSEKETIPTPVANSALEDNSSGEAVDPTETNSSSNEGAGE